MAAGLDRARMLSSSHTALLGMSSDYAIDEEVAKIFATPITDLSWIERPGAPGAPGVPGALSPAEMASPALLFISASDETCVLLDSKSNQAQTTKKIAEFLRVIDTGAEFRDKEALAGSFEDGHYCFGLSFDYSSLLCFSEASAQAYLENIKKIASWDGTLEYLAQKTTLNSKEVIMKDLFIHMIKKIHQAQTPGKQYKRFMPRKMSEILCFSVKGESEFYHIKNTHIIIAEHLSAKALAEILDESNLEGVLINLLVDNTGEELEYIDGAGELWSMDHTLTLNYRGGMWYLFDPLLGEPIATKNKDKIIQILLAITKRILSITIASFDEDFELTESQKKYAGFYNYVKNVSKGLITHDHCSPLLILDYMSIHEALYAYPEIAEEELLGIISVYGLKNLSHLQKELLAFALSYFDMPSEVAARMLYSLLQEQVNDKSLLEVLQEKNPEEYEQLCTAISNNYGAEFLIACRGESAVVKAGAGDVVAPFKDTGEAKGVNRVATFVEHKAGR